MMMVVGGGVLPLIQNYIADTAGYMISYIVPLLGLFYLFLRNDQMSMISVVKAFATALIST